MILQPRKLRKSCKPWHRAGLEGFKIPAGIEIPVSVTLGIGLVLALAVLGWTQGLTGFSQPKPSHEFMISLQHPKSLIPWESSAQNLTWVEEPKVTSEQKRGRKIQGFFFCFLEDLVHSFLTPQFPGVHVRYCIEKFPWISFSAKRATPPSSQPLLQEELSSLEITPQTLIIQTGLKANPKHPDHSFFSALFTGFYFSSLSLQCPWH